jgi:hypothetical protein
MFVSLFIFFSPLHWVGVLVMLQTCVQEGLGSNIGLDFSNLDIIIYFYSILFFLLWARTLQIQQNNKKVKYYFIDDSVKFYLFSCDDAVKAPD